ncbi:MAG: transglutaminase family protein [Gemmatimonadetes bacterium]|jgi:transglutaminase-like putative cysteine protease|nr:transglutaminase family protein [Gemmatimonadota bacterium]MBT5146405.1 transglutaminase family protein [Gemmatimonadota bacterium]MBT5591328.1 transglutaminase family protein [Gemmatimonadota bacterium]MBT5962217.1 transglutaminase family protein [Gemmatimonadota bacterium]MBT6627234.1 transglutaminase family protein [Gemmatimonadota bacterium]
MRFEIRHETEYQYSHAVFLEPHLLRIRPRSDASQRLIEFDLEISPEPTGCAHLVDLDGNATMRPWFSGHHDHLRFVSHSIVETLRDQPFAYLLDAEADSLPVQYEQIQLQLAPYLRHDAGPAVTDLAAQILSASESKPATFARLLNQRIHDLCPTETRLEGDPLTPAQTLGRGRGACRDVSVLFMEVCRVAGLAARFTSGYVAGSADQERFLHAWAEVYLPGAGWRGYDPSLGLVVADRHVALASGPGSMDARPFVGRFRGSNVEAQMSVQLQISTDVSA